MSGIFFKQIIRCKIGSATKPTVDDFVLLIIQFKHAVIAMHCWHKWIERMNDQATRPQANHLSPSIFNCVRMASVTSPKTTEVFTPPFSNTVPFAITLVFPPPPSGRSHSSSINFALPSASSNAAQMRFCKSCM